VAQPTGQLANQVTSPLPGQAINPFSGQDAPTLPVTSAGQDPTELGIPATAALTGVPASGVFDFEEGAPGTTKIKRSKRAKTARPPKPPKKPKRSGPRRRRWPWVVAIIVVVLALLGAGAVVGGLLVAAVGRTGLRPLVIASGAFGAVIGLAALAPTLPVELAALALVGWASISFMATGNSTLQLGAAPSMRGRVMSLWFVAFQGSTPIGGPLVGWIMAWAGARAGLGVGAIACLLVALVGLMVLRGISPFARADSAAQAMES